MLYTDKYDVMWCVVFHMFRPWLQLLIPFSPQCLEELLQLFRGDIPLYMLYSHCVLLLSGHVRFIDYEYSSYNYQAFDIGNHFNEFAGLLNHNVIFILELMFIACHTAWLIIRPCVRVRYQEWPSWTTGCIPVGRCRWTGSECTCRRTSSSPRKQRRSARESWRRSMYRSTSLLWWGGICWRTHTPATQSHTLTHIVSYYFNLITYLFLLRLLTSFGVSGHSSRPNTPPSTLTSSGKLLRKCVKGSEQCVATPWVRIT